jgi:hypothetical protein
LEVTIRDLQISDIESTAGPLELIDNEFRIGVDEMATIIVTDELERELAAATQTAQLVTEDGRVLGRFVPLAPSDDLDNEAHEPR